MSATMRAARLHAVGEPMKLEDLPIPTPGPNDVRVEVRAVNIVPNLANILHRWPTWYPRHPLPTLPAIFGLDAAGVVDGVGEAVQGFSPGDHVYINPGRYCGSCRACRHGDGLNCASYAYAGYFGHSPTSVELMDRYQGGLAEFTIAPDYSLVRLPRDLAFEQAARFGYLGTMYAALRLANLAPGRSLLVNGISGTLGIGAALLAPALGLTDVYGTGRDRTLLAKVNELAPGRFRLHSLDDGPVDEWIMQETDDYGVDAYIDALGAAADPHSFVEGMRALARGGTAVNIGGVSGDVPIDVRWLMGHGQRLIGSAWFTAGQGQELADLCSAGLLDLSPLEHQVHRLEDINDALNGLGKRNGGFSNFIIKP